MVLGGILENRLRFAPSPTGYVHVGGLRTALYNYLFAKQSGGKYILRIEDTDRTRLVEHAVEYIVQSCEWVGIHHDEGPYVQSERLALYHQYVNQLIEQGDAYYCFCSKDRLDHIREEQRQRGENPKYDGHCREGSIAEAKERIAAGESYVVRLKLPRNRNITFTDEIKGTVTVNTDDLDDQVLLKTDGYPTYHMAVVVDDHEMGITHVVRGDEWLISTPKHIYLYQALGWTPPTFVHLPVILGKNKKKLSKRQGDVAVMDFYKKGYLPEAFINFIALVGWSPANDQEILSMDEMIDQFSFDRVSKSSGIFDVDKLNWLNNHYLRQADLDRLLALSRPIFIESGYCTEETFEQHADSYRQIIDLLRERLHHLSEIAEYKDFFTSDQLAFESQEAEDILHGENVGIVLQAFKEKIHQQPDSMDAVQVKQMLKEIQKETGIKGKGLFMPIRVAVTGSIHGPDIGQTFAILGPNRVIKRLCQAIDRIQ